MFNLLAKNTDVTSTAALCNIAVLYHRVLIDDNPGQVRGEMMKWLQNDLLPDITISEFDSVQVLECVSFTHLNRLLTEAV